MGVQCSEPMLRGGKFTPGAVATPTMGISLWGVTEPVSLKFSCHPQDLAPASLVDPSLR